MKLFEVRIYAKVSLDRDDVDCGELKEVLLTVGARKAKDIRDSYERTWSSNCAVEVEGAFLSEGVIVSIESITLDEVENHIVLHSEGLDNTMYHVCSPQVIGPPTIEYPVCPTYPNPVADPPPSHYWDPNSFPMYVGDDPMKRVYGPVTVDSARGAFTGDYPRHRCLGDFEPDTAATDASWDPNGDSPCQCGCKGEQVELFEKAE